LILPTLVCAGFILLYDTLGAVASRQFGFKYGYFAIGTLFRYGLIGGRAAAARGSLAATIVVAVVGGIDATVGLSIARRLRVTGSQSSSPNYGRMAVVGVVIGALVGALSGVLIARS
jgi:hypothetical protein